MKKYKFQIDDWVVYDPYVSSLDQKYGLKGMILEVLENDLFYDYKIFIDGKGTITKVRGENLFPCKETT
jgi:hypothetical protein